ncbi:MAG TPA: insulinase family protein, partial [Planctomycetota bacterium]|nr:insulinase family protein [Planctomycetota bacterium]
MIAGRAGAALALSLALALTSSPARADEPLPNGLRALVRPIRGTDRVALVVVYPVGEAHDPPGLSGLAHLAEHVLATSAAGEAPSRTAEEIAARYVDGWNAHTSWDYTVLATGFPRDRVEAEVADA